MVAMTTGVFFGSFKNMSGLECGHKFCRLCWGEYLKTKIMDEGMGQVSLTTASLVTHISVPVDSTGDLFFGIFRPYLVQLTNVTS